MIGGGGSRRYISAQFKFQLALEAATGLKTIHEWASAPGVHPHQVSEWQRQLLQGGRAIFRRGGAGHQREQQEQEGALYEPIGRLNMALEWLNKTAASFS